MNQALDKLGIYDLVAVLLSGVCITTFSLLAEKMFWKTQLLLDYLKVDDSILFLTISYFIGLVFQELSSILQKKITHRNNKLLLKALDTSKKSYPFLTQEEKNGIIQIVQTELASETAPNEEILYNYCRYYLASTGNMVRADKEQSIFGMSRSLSLYFFVLFLFMACKSICSRNIILFVWTASIFVLSVLLYYRCLRFSKMRYIYILRSFYYSFIQNKSNNITKGPVKKNREK